jgi:hypothetical protein
MSSQFPMLMCRWALFKQLHGRLAFAFSGDAVDAESWNPRRF